jgi:outer membrane immunogenic protein
LAHHPIEAGCVFPATAIWTNPGILGTSNFEFFTWVLEMKKIAIALTALAALTGSAAAADLPAHTYSKAPVPMVVSPNWTGGYIFGGFGAGLWDANTSNYLTATGTCVVCVNNKQGGDGWLATVGAGYDWQFNGRWVAGVLADGQFGSMKGSESAFGFTLNEKLRDTWAVGVRVGYLIAPNVLSYVNGGYTGADWSGSTIVNQNTGVTVGAHTNSFTTQGWFLGGGVENNLDIFGVTAPGWFMKTEYRGAYYSNKNSDWLNDVTNTQFGLSTTFKPFVQTISTSLVYRFNWTGPVVAKY